MENKVWNLIETETLVSGCDWNDAKNSIQAKVFGAIVELAKDKISYYHSDLYHDAIYLHEILTSPMGFEWVARESGTFIGETARLIKDEDWPNSDRYRFVVRLEGTARWILDIYKSVSLDNKRSEAAMLRDLKGTVAETIVEEEVDLGAKYRDAMQEATVLTDEDESAIDALLERGAAEKPTLRTTTRKEPITLEDMIQELREKLSVANDELETARDKLNELQDFVYGLESYSEELGDFISNIEDVPEYEGEFEYDASFDSNN